MSKDFFVVCTLQTFRTYTLRELMPPNVGENDTVTHITTPEEFDGLSTEQRQEALYFVEDTWWKEDPVLYYHIRNWQLTENGLKEGETWANIINLPQEKATTEKKELAVVIDYNIYDGDEHVAIIRPDGRLEITHPHITPDMLRKLATTLEEFNNDDG